jgi:hypothetical protein
MINVPKTINELLREVTKRRERDEKLCYLEDVLCAMEDAKNTNNEVYRQARSMSKNL